jgi:hypothetical protein
MLPNTVRKQSLEGCEQTRERMFENGRSDQESKRYKMSGGIYALRRKHIECHIQICHRDNIIYII